MSARHKKTAVRWLSTLVAFAAVAVMLFPIYAIIVASFESSVTLFSSHFHFFPYHPTLANYRTVVLGVQAGAAGAVTVSGNQLGHVLTSFEVPHASHGLARRSAAPRSDRSIHRFGHVSARRLTEGAPGEHTARSDPLRWHLRRPVRHSRLAGFLVQSAQ